jgi:hypothetical protein
MLLFAPEKSDEPSVIKLRLYHHLLPDVPDLPADVRLYLTCQNKLFFKPELNK